MAFYRNHVYPEVVSVLGNPPPIQKIRERIIPLAHGTVLEIGVGPGVNFPHYDRTKVDKIFALEPNPGMVRRAEKLGRQTKTNLIWPRSHAFVFVVCCQLLALGQSTEPPSQSTSPAQQQPSPNATPNDKQPATQPPASQPGQPRPVRSKASQTPRERAWQLLESACASDKTADRATATLVLGLIPNNVKSARLAEKALADDKAEVRSAGAAALGEMKSRSSIPKLRAAFDDQDPLVVLAAAHSLDLMHDNSAYEVYYEVLNGERKAKKGLISSQASLFHDPKRMAALGFEEGIGFIPFAGIGWGAVKAIAKDDSSPVRAAAAKVLARDPDPATTRALTDAAGDKSWIVQTAALEALAKRGDRSALNTAEKYMADEKDAVRYTAAAAVLRLTAIKEASKSDRRR